MENHSGHRDTAASSGGAVLAAWQTWLWIALLLVAAILRLTDLGSAPLDSAEAAQALAAYRSAHLLPPQMVELFPTTPPSPFLYHLNTLLFALFDGGDGLARLVPALAGVLLVLTPLLLRRYLGPWGALGMGLLLALSPTALLASRTLDGTMPALLGVMLLTGCAINYLDSWRPRLVTLGALGLALALTAGPAAWGLLLGLLVVVGVALSIWSKQVEWIRPMLEPALRRGLIVAGVALLALGGGLGLHLPGLADTAQQLLLWLGRLGAGDGGPSPLVLLLVYEPLLLLAALGGLAVAIQRRHMFGLLWALWAAVSAAQLALMPGRQPFDLLWLLLPLSGLGGLAIQKLADSLAAYGHWLNEGLYLPVSLVLWAHGWLALARYARTGDSTSLFVAILTLLLQVFLAAAFGFALATPESEDEELAPLLRSGSETALRAGALSVGVFLLAVTLSFGWGLTHLRPGDPRELAVRDALAPEIRVLAQVVERVAQLNSGTDTEVDVGFLGPADPALVWLLRRFDLQPVARQTLDPQAEIVVIATGYEQAPADWVGERFVLRRGWVLPTSGHDRARWWLYRETGTPLYPIEQIALWVPVSMTTAARTP